MSVTSTGAYWLDVLNLPRTPAYWTGGPYVSTVPNLPPQSVKARSLWRATKDDCESFWRLRNAKDVREASSHSAPISLVGHVLWWTSKDERRVMYVIKDAEERRVGYLRVQV